MVLLRLAYVGGLDVMDRADLEGLAVPSKILTQPTQNGKEPKEFMSFGGISLNPLEAIPSAFDQYRRLALERPFRGGFDELPGGAPDELFVDLGDLPGDDRPPVSESV